MLSEELRDSFRCRLKIIALNSPTLLAFSGPLAIFCFALSVCFLQLDLSGLTIFRGVWNFLFCLLHVVRAHYPLENHFSFPPGGLLVPSPARTLECPLHLLLLFLTPPNCLSCVGWFPWKSLEIFPLAGLKLSDPVFLFCKRV